MRQQIFSERNQYATYLFVCQIVKARFTEANDVRLRSIDLPFFVDVISNVSFPRLPL